MRWTPLALLAAAQFMLILDVTVINVALPSIGADLDLGRETLTWAVTAYTLCFGGLMLLGGRLGDAIGGRRTLLAGLALFTLASLVTGLANDATVLIGGRIAQGVGAALLSPSALATVTRMFHGAERNRALGVWAALGGAGFAVGAVLGGALTSGPGWRWVFYINVPVGAALLALLPRIIPAAPGTGRRVDLPGAALVTGGTAALIYGLVKAGDTGWGSAAALLPLLASVVLYAVFAWVERSTGEPLMDPRILVRRPVATGAFLMLAGTALMLGILFLGSFYLQQVRGLSAIAVGALFLPVAVAAGIGGHLGGRLAGRLGARPVAVAGLLAAAAGSAILTQGAGTAWTIVGLAIAVAGVVPAFVAATTTALGFVSHAEAGLASGIVNTFHEVGGAVGIAVASTLAAPSLLAGTASGFTGAYAVLAVAALGASAAAAVLVPKGVARLPEGVAVGH